MSRAFRRYIGIDYSGGGESTAANSGIQIFEASGAGATEAVRSPEGGDRSRAGVASLGGRFFYSGSRTEWEEGATHLQASD